MTQTYFQIKLEYKISFKMKKLYLDPWFHEKVLKKFLINISKCKYNNKNKFLEESFAV